MILAPIDGRQFAQACRPRPAHPAPCRFAQLFRLILLAVVGGSLIFVSLGAKNLRAEPVVMTTTA